MYKVLLILNVKSFFLNEIDVILCDLGAERFQANLENRS
jgi:hypothetical protein